VLWAWEWFLDWVWLWYRSCRFVHLGVVVGCGPCVLGRRGEWSVWCDSWKMVDDGLVLHPTWTEVLMVQKHTYACS